MDFHRGLVRAYDAATHTAAVLLAGSMSRVLLAIPVAHHIPPYQITVGTACGVAFFAEGSKAVVLCILDGPPPAPYILYEDTGTDLTLTTSWQTIPSLSIPITPPTPETWTVAVMAQVLLRSASATADLAEHYAQIARDGSLVGTTAYAIFGDAWTGSTVPLFFQDTVTYTTPRTYTIQAKKSAGAQAKTASASRMTIIALKSA